MSACYVTAFRQASVVRLNNSAALRHVAHVAGNDLAPVKQKERMRLVMFFRLF
jgi:hypothetical protein